MQQSPGGFVLFRSFKLQLTDFRNCFLVFLFLFCSQNVNFLTIFHQEVCLQWRHHEPLKNVPDELSSILHRPQSSHQFPFHSFTSQQHSSARNMHLCLMSDVLAFSHMPNQIFLGSLPDHGYVGCTDKMDKCCINTWQWPSTQMALCVDPIFIYDCAQLLLCLMRSLVSRSSVLAMDQSTANLPNYNSVLAPLQNTTKPPQLILASTILVATNYNSLQVIVWTRIVQRGT